MEKNTELQEYVVKQRWLSGIGKKMWASGDVVTEKDFPKNFHTLLKEGRIVTREVSEEEAKAQAAAREEAAREEAAREEAAKDSSDSEASPDVTDEETVDNQETTSDDTKTASDLIADAAGEDSLFEFDGKPIFTEDDLSKKDICKKLDSMEGVEYKKTSNKTTLWNTIIENLK